MTRILLTGFAPFAGDRSNSSGDAVSLVGSRWNGPHELVTATLPVTFADRTLEALLAEHSPDIVIATGVANGRADVTPERVAINLADARIPDNAGQQPLDLPVIGGAVDGLFSGLPVKAIVERMRAAGVPASVSQSAGTFVCNAVMFRLMDAVAGTDVRAGFIHVPSSPGLAGPDEPFLEIEDIARALEAAIAATLEHPVDVAVTGGTVA